MGIKIEPVRTIEALNQPLKPTVQSAMDGANQRAGPGRPPSGKVRVTLLLSPDVIEKFKATGPGWQSRMNEALKAAKV